MREKQKNLNVFIWVGALDFSQMRVLPAKGKYIPIGVEVLKRGHPAVLPTDTLYGICADATNPKAVENIYTLKWRNRKKPLIVLVDDLLRLEEFFNITPNGLAKKLLLHPKPVSVILPVKGFEYLTRGGRGIAFRLVKGGFIKEFLQEFGKPVVAPSANWEGHPPAREPFQAYLYFGDAVPLYYNGGILKGNPSALISLLDPKKVEVLRKGNLTEEEIKDLTTFKGS